MVAEPRTIAALGRAIRTGQTRAEAATERCLAEIRARDPEINAFIHVAAEDAVAQARQADRDMAAGRDRGPLHGVPISFKDLIDVRGMPTTAASRVRHGGVAVGDAEVVRRLRDAGAVVIGKTNLHEFAFGTTNEDSGWGAARNPHDPTRSPGGSSGGSAIAVQTGMSLASIGTDTGGSIRIPAAACGVVGLKPSWGEISADGVVPLSRQLDHVGPLARTVTDAWLVHEVLAGREPAPDARLTPATLKGARIGLLGGYFWDRMAVEVEAVARAGVEALERAGAILEPVTVPHAADMAAIYLHLVFGDAAAYHAATLESHPNDYTPNVRLRLEMGRYVLAEDYGRAMRGRELIAREIDQALEGRVALVCPTLPIAAPPIGAATVPVRGGDEPVRNAMLRLTQPFNLGRQPALSLPCGLTPQGLPVGLQLVGPFGHTLQLLQLAAACERVLPDS